MFGEDGHDMVMGLGVVETSCVWCCDNCGENGPTGRTMIGCEGGVRGLSTGWIFGEDGLCTMASRFDFLLGKVCVQGTGWFSEENGDLLTGRPMRE